MYMYMHCLQDDGVVNPSHFISFVYTKNIAFAQVATCCTYTMFKISQAQFQ